MNADATAGDMAEKSNWSIHWVLDEEVLLEHPLELVWPIFRDIRKLSDTQVADYNERLSSNWHRSWSTAVEGLEATLAGVGNSG